jgi:quercetin dioxygenase-like cupin family protein
MRRRPSGRNADGRPGPRRGGLVEAAALPPPGAAASRVTARPAAYTLAWVTGPSWEETSVGALPEVQRVVDLVSYQDGAIVSRIVVKRETGNVTLFAFDAAQELSEHTAPYDALVQVVDGEAEITVAGRPYRVRAGEMIVMPAHQPHALRAVTRFKMLLTMIRS